MFTQQLAKCFTVSLFVLVAPILSYGFDVDKIAQLPEEAELSPLPEIIFDINQKSDRQDRLWQADFTEDEKAGLLLSIKYWLNFNFRTHPELFNKHLRLTRLPKDKQSESLKLFRSEKYKAYVSLNGAEPEKFTEADKDVIRNWSADDVFSDINPFMWKLPKVIRIDKSQKKWKIADKSIDEIMVTSKGKSYFYESIKGLPGAIQSLTKSEIVVPRMIFHGGKVRVGQLKNWLTLLPGKYGIKIFASYSVDLKVGLNFTKISEDKIADLEQARISSSHPTKPSYLEDLLHKSPHTKGLDSSQWIPAFFVRQTKNGMTKTLSDWSAYPGEMEILRLPETIKIIALKSMKSTCSQILPSKKEMVAQKEDALIVFAKDEDQEDLALKNSLKTELDICKLYLKI